MDHRRKLGAAALVVAAVAGTVALIGPSQLGQFIHTLVADPVQELDEDAPPSAPSPPGATRVLLIALDGVGDEQLREAVRAGEMPRLARALGAQEGQAGYDHAFAAPKVLSILPSTTVAAWTSVFTGQGVARHGVAGNEMFDRTVPRFSAPAPVSVGSIDDMMETFHGGLVGDLVRAETLFEKIGDRRSHVSLGHVHRGATVFTTPSGLEAAPIFRAFIEGATAEGEDGEQQLGAKALDEASVDALFEATQEHGVPDLQVVYFPGIDLHTHVSEDALEAQRDYLTTVTDPALGRIFDHWQGEGVWEQTWLIVTADHGHTPVWSDDRHSLGPEGDDEPPAVLEAMGFTMRALEVGEVEGEASAVLAYQGAFAYLHLADRSACSPACDWGRPPRLEEDVLPVARAFYQASHEGTHVAAMKGTLDLVLARPPRPPQEPAEPLQVFDGEELVPVEAYLAAHPRPDLLHFAPRLREMSAGPHGHVVGDVVLMAHSGADLPIEERFYFSGPYRSWHGSAKASDSVVPLIVGHPQHGAAAIEAQVLRAIGPGADGWHSQRDVTPLVVSLLGSSPASAPSSSAAAPPSSRAP